MAKSSRAPSGVTPEDEEHLIGLSAVAAGIPLLSETKVRTYAIHITHHQTDFEHNLGLF